MSETRISSQWGKITFLVVICCIALPTQAKYGGGTGEPNDPYLIYTAEQMNEIGMSVNWDDLHKCFKLMADIDLGGYTGREFNIIGTYWEHPFTGVFDGNGHTISNFTYTSTGTSYIGLFANIDDPNAEIKNLGLIDPNVDAGTGDDVGSLVSQLRTGTITNCYVQGGSVSGDRGVGGLVGYNRSSTISNCHAIGSVSGDRSVGGLVGYNYRSTISNCHAAGSIIGNENVGGLVGRNVGTITNCYARCSVSSNGSVGGLVGYNYYDSKIINCYSTGSVTGTTEVGGLVGSNFGYIFLCYWDIETSGVSESDGGEGKTTAEMKIMSTYYGWGYGAAWTIDEGVDYPRLVWENAQGVPIEDPPRYYGGGSGTASKPYLIYTAEHLNTIGRYPADLACHFKLTADIDLSGFGDREFNIIGYVIGFSGVFDGNGHTISNFTYTSTETDNIGFFGYVSGENAEIKNLGLIDPNVEAGGHYVGSLIGQLENGSITNCYVEGGSVSGEYSVGGLVGMSYRGRITNCYSTGSVSGGENVGGLVGRSILGIITNCYSSGSVSGGENVGGLVGRARGAISNCYSSGSVLGGVNVGGLVGSGGAISNCYSTGSVSGNYCVGGLVGRNVECMFNFCYGGTISNCFSTGNVTGFNYVGGLVGDNFGMITNCDSSGDVSGLDCVGGLVGRNGGTITNCYSTTSVFGSSLVGGLVGYPHEGSITDCYASGNVTGDEYVGGLMGYNSATITNCYSEAIVSGITEVGGLVGYNNYYGTIANCYSTGSASGTENIGGLIGYNNIGDVTASFWDIETSGQDTSAGGIGLPTAEMQMISTFTDAGWDFVVETFNGIEDIWFIPQQDYPHLWWEGMQVPMKLTPRTLNCRSEGNWVKAHITLPQGFTVADVDPDRPAVLHSFGFPSAPLYVFVNKDKLVEIEAAFEREAVCSLVGNLPVELTVAGFLTDGNIFLGISTVRIIHPGMKVIEDLTSCWLNADCVHPDFCNGIDSNRDSSVNMRDYALLLNTQVEFVTDE